MGMSSEIYRDFRLNCEFASFRPANFLYSTRILCSLLDRLVRISRKVLHSSSLQFALQEVRRGEINSALLAVHRRQGTQNSCHQIG